MAAFCHTDTPSASATTIEPNQFSEATGIIVIEVTARALTDEEESRIRLVVEDAAGAKAAATTPISVRGP